MLKLNKLLLLMSFLALSSCGGEKDKLTNGGEKDKLTNGGEKDKLTNDAGGHAINFQAALGMLKVDDKRQKTALEYAKILFSNKDNKIEKGFYTYDYLQDGEDGYIKGKIHSGVDFDSGTINAKVSSLVTGKIVDIGGKCGKVTIETLINDKVVRFNHVHLDPDTIKDLKVGDLVKQGQYIGIESNTCTGEGKNNIHLHIEAFTPCLSENLLDIEPSSKTWDYALDPMDLEMSKAIIRGDTSEVPLDKKTRFHSLGFQTEFIKGKKNYLKGCVYSSEGFGKNIRFDILNHENHSIYNETYEIKNKENNFLSLRSFNFGTEKVFLDTPLETKKIRVSIENILGDGSYKDIPLPSTNIIAPEDKSTKSDVSLSRDYFYIRDEPSIKGCINDPDGIDINSITLKVINTSTGEVLPSYSNPNYNFRSCEGIKNSVNFRDFRYKGVKALPVGNYTMQLEAKDILGTLFQTERMPFQVKSQIKSVEFSETGTRKLIVHRINHDANYGIVNLPACLWIKVEPKTYVLALKMSQNPDDLGMYIGKSRSLYMPHVPPRTNRDFILYTQCSTNVDPVVVFSGSLYFP